ncbi:DNL-type zinc finger protein [Quillaja saponaria]|uniref:DNL-type zinc finger protein n=1 Tax=Quillaja saponaria TaxID=32244 RepID=A0AAD7PFT4_QUISA|nr:DNL-type zinc finger protein [Quillaja saponaria]
MAATTVYRFSPALPFVSYPTDKRRQPIYSLCSNSLKPISFSKPNPSIRFSRSRISHEAAILAQKRTRRVLEVFGLVDGDSATDPESESKNPDTGATINVRLPRRSLLVQFTCNECGERTKRLVNRLAYERGVIFVQCAGCLQHHKLVDNLGLVMEYDFREETTRDSESDQV